MTVLSPPAPAAEFFADVRRMFAALQQRGVAGAGAFTAGAGAPPSPDRASRGAGAGASAGVPVRLVIKQLEGLIDESEARCVALLLPADPTQPLTHTRACMRDDA